MSRLTFWPAEDAPLSAWLRPVSATLRNLREVPTCSSAEESGQKLPGQSASTVRRRRRKALEAGA